MTGDHPMCAGVGWLVHAMNVSSQWLLANTTTWFGLRARPGSKPVVQVHAFVT